MFKKWFKKKDFEQILDPILYHLAFINIQHPDFLSTTSRSEFSDSFLLKE